MRARVSLLLSEGHTHARHYPLIVVWQEVQIVKERVNGRIATETVALQTVMNAVNSAEKSAHTALEKFIERLQNGR